MTAKRPLTARDINPEVFYKGTDREIIGRALCDIGGRSRVGIGVLDLPAGSNTKPAHYHTKEEEHLYVVQGSMTLHLGQETYEMKEGDYVCFPANAPNAHYLDNQSGAVCSYLIIGERISDDKVIYPANPSNNEN